MKTPKVIRTVIFLLVFALLPCVGTSAVTNRSSVLPVAILKFQENGKGVKSLGNKVSNLLFANMVTDPEMFLIDRADLKTILSELELNASGMVDPNQANRIGQLTGAKVFITGSIMKIDKTIYVVAKILGTENSRVLGSSVKFRSGEALEPQIENLAVEIAQVIKDNPDKLVPPIREKKDVASHIRNLLGDSERPVVMVNVEEQHIGRPVNDPAAETEIIYFLKESGFTVYDSKRAPGNSANVLIEGEGFSEFAGTRGNLISVKARLEIKAIDLATDQIIGIDRQTTVSVDLTEALAGKSALQKAAGMISERLLPKLIMGDK